MTIAVHASPGRPSDDGVAWRALRRGLWVARVDGKHLGAVEHGRRWAASDADGEPIGAFRTFPEAQAAVADPAAHRVPVRPGTAARPALVLLGLCAAVVVSTGGWAWVDGWVSPGGWMWTALLF